MRQISLILLVVAFNLQVRSEDLKTSSFKVDSQTYTNPTIKYPGQGDVVKVFHSSGIATLKIDELPPEIKDQFLKHYNLDEEEMKEAAKASKQDDIDRAFRNQCLKDGWVTYIEQNYGNNFYVRLPSNKYTTKENVKSIAEFMAKAYVNQNKLKGGKHTSATVHVFIGNDVYARGSYRD